METEALSMHNIYKKIIGHEQNLLEFLHFYICHILCSVLYLFGPFRLKLTSPYLVELVC